MYLTSFFNKKFVTLQCLLVHLRNGFIDVFGINKINEGIGTLHDNFSNLTVLLKGLFKVIGDNASADTSYVDLRGLSDTSFVPALSRLAATAFTAVMVASAAVHRATSASRRAPSVSSRGVGVATFARVGAVTS
jgi:hypothetical protein